MIVEGFRCHQVGDIVQAEQLYRQILEADPRHADANHLVGVLAFQSGRHEEAVSAIRRAIAEKPAVAVFHTNLALACSALGRSDEALASVQEAVCLDPHSADAHNHLANILRTIGNADLAAAHCRQALQLRPAFPEAHNNLGNILRAQRQSRQAAIHYREALRLKPDFVEVLWNLGGVLVEMGNLDEAIACYQQAVHLAPLDAEAHLNLGDAWLIAGKLDEAIRSFQQALRLRQDDSAIHAKLADALTDHGRPMEALAHLRELVRLQPNVADAHNNLGGALFKQKKLNEASRCFQDAARLDPRMTSAISNIVVTLAEQGKIEETVPWYRRALQLEPENVLTLGGLAHSLQQLCIWDDLEDISLRTIGCVEKKRDPGTQDYLAPFTFLALPTPTTAEQQLTCSRLYVEQRFHNAFHGTPKFGHRPPRRAGSRIALGYLSADFHAHPTAFLIAELLEKHNRGRFEVHAYSYGQNDSSAIRQRLEKACDRFVDFQNTPSVDAAQRIQADGIDILIDLKGHTCQARTDILALHPAAVQVNYLGYPGTMGAPFIDYILIDDFVVPADQQLFFTEKLVHLPECYQVNDSRRPISPRQPTRAECGLPSTGFVFCCFNGAYKITPTVFDVWTRLLHAVPGSVLWLLGTNAIAAANLRKEAKARGVKAERLVFAPGRQLAEHSVRYRLADLFLDTFPVNAHTTASDALWVGCPVLTMAGQTFVSRVAGSLLRTIGLPELIANSLDEYHDLALRLARNPAWLADLRTRLQANRDSSGLFDGARFARNLEKAYATMWELHLSGAKPRAFRVLP